MAYWQLFYHIVWSTKNREPLITPSAEPEIHNLIKTKAIGLGGTVFAVNGIDEHVHVVTAIPPRIAAATFVGQVKGATTAKYNQGRSAEGKIYWQDEYGIFSFDRKRLPNVVAYVENQKQHHAEERLIPVLERTDDGGVQMIRETSALYATNHDIWWTEMLALDDSS